MSTTFTVRLLRPGSPLILGSYDVYQEAKERMEAMLQMLSIGTIEVLAGDYVIDRETTALFHKTS